jgi:hypothetical protein
MKLRTLVLGAVAGLVMTACGGGSNSSPESVTESFVKALAAGDCDKALTMSSATALETVETSKESGCEGYESEIVGEITCTTEEESATCKCTEKRDILGEMTFNYDLEKVDGNWKVSAYNKDMAGMEDMMGGEGAE